MQILCKSKSDTSPCYEDDKKNNDGDCRRCVCFVRLSFYRCVAKLVESVSENSCQNIALVRMFFEIIFIFEYDSVEFIFA